MASESFDLVTDLVVDNSSVTGNGKHVIWHFDKADDVAMDNLNTNGDIKYNTLFLEIEYKDLVPTFTSGRLQLFIDTKPANSTHWMNVTAQSQGLAELGNGARQTFLISPSIVDNTFGGSNDISDGSVTVVKQHTRNGLLSDEWRVCLVLNETGFGTASEFQSAKISIGGVLSST